VRSPDSVGYVTSLEGLDLESVGPWLAAQGLVEEAPVEAVRLAGGLSNVTYLVTQGERELVIRRPPLGHVMPTAHDMGREFTVLSGVTRGGFLAPQPLAYCDDDSVIGARFLVMEYVAGRIISSDAAAQDLTAADASALSAELIDVLAALHAIDARAVGLGELGRPEGFLSRQVTRWAQQWELSKTRELPAIDELIAWLQSRVDALPLDLPWSIVHGDYRLDNAIVDPHEPRIRAVLDWEMATLGDPLMDLATMLVYWSRPGDELRHQIRFAAFVTDREGFWERAELVNTYAERSGIDVGHLDVCIVLSGLKLAVIMESIRKRTLAGQQLGADTSLADGMAMATDALAEMGLAVASGGGVDALSR
jgi:aminoglycoside phosphotransferase (APT) family kinase protein